MHRFWGAVAAAGLAAGVAYGGGTLTDGDSSFQIVGTPAGGTIGNANWLVGAQPDQLFYYSWGYRVPLNNQNSQMSRFDTPTESYTGNTATITWLNAGPGPVGFARFDAELELTLTDSANPGASQLGAVMTITNLNPNPLTIEIFNQTDFDTGTVANDDSGSITDTSAVLYSQTDTGSALFAEALATGADRYQVGNGFTVRNLVNNSTSIDLNNDASFSGDVGVAFQWTLTLDPGESRTIHHTIAINSSVTLACSPADLTTQGAGAGDPGFGVPDGQVTASDIQFYVNAFVANDASIADLTTQGAGPGDPGFGVPDGQVTASDIQFYVNLFVAGCP